MLTAPLSRCKGDPCKRREDDSSRCGFGIVHELNPVAFTHVSVAVKATVWPSPTPSSQAVGVITCVGNCVAGSPNVSGSTARRWSRSSYVALAGAPAAHATKLGGSGKPGEPFVGAFAAG